MSLKFIEQRSRESTRDQIIRTPEVTKFYKANRDVGMVDSHDNKLKMIQCIQKLLNYAIVLLKPKNMRPGSWEVS